MLIGLQSCSLQIHTCLTSWYHLCVCWGGECAHVPTGAHIGMCLWTRTIQFGQPWKVAWMKGTAFRDVSSQIKALQRRCDFCGLVLWSFPKQFLVAERAVSKSSWKHFSEPCSWIQIITCACLCVCVSVCVCVEARLCHRSQPSKTASKSRGLNCQLCEGTPATIPDKTGGKPQPYSEEETGGFLCLFLARKERRPRGGLNSSVWSDIYHHAPALAAQKADFGRDVPRGHGVPGGARTDGAGSAAGAAAGSRAWRKAALRSTVAPGEGRTGGLRHAGARACPLPRGWARSAHARTALQCLCLFFFFSLNSTYLKKQLIKKVTLEDGCTQHGIHSWLTRRTVLLCGRRGRVHAAPSLRDLLLDDRELFLKFTELGAVFRFIIPTLHHDFKYFLWTVLRGWHPVSWRHERRTENLGRG